MSLKSRIVGSLNTIVNAYVDIDLAKIDEELATLLPMFTANPACDPFIARKILQEVDQVDAFGSWRRTSWTSKRRLICLTNNVAGS